MNIDISIYETSIIPAIMFLLYILSKAGVPKKLLPAIAAVLGIFSGLFLISFDGTGIVTGILLAAAAIGFHSGSKNTKEAYSISE
ncbi:MAG: phage holin family protein [Paenibacillus dendritiformis]|uniref:phage holin family protein n=1 Tax=uncultured Paenibacillus sp. TaxID=227322 RepID=UPI0025E73967|nr:phage holin family protein [uncultured Paenibacillus sp.]MDU5141047.1 phage holin family protein [Paenibacillus dendritiformis]